MVTSMTGFAREAIHEKWGQAVWEIRSVNHRYLDLSFKMPESFRQWEPIWRQQVAHFVQRGKVECYLSFVDRRLTSLAIEVNEELAVQLLSAMKKITHLPGVDPTITIKDILRWPEVLRLEKENDEELKKPLSSLFEKALTSLTEMRKREGQNLKSHVAQKLEQATEKLAAIREVLPQASSERREKLLAKIQDLKMNIEPQRLEQEIVLLMVRSDIEEEIERLTAHIKEVSHILGTHDAIGRRLDFLMQEMNREANTLSAKAINQFILEKGLDLKVLIEQMREQIQNVE